MKSRSFLAILARASVIPVATATFWGGSLSIAISAPAMQAGKITNP